MNGSDAYADPSLTKAEQMRFDEMTRQSYKRVYSLAYRLAGNRPDAEDLTQEAFCRAYRSFDQYDGVRPFENWVLRIVSRLFLDLVRHRRRRLRAVSYDAHLKSEEKGIDVLFDAPDEAPSPEEVLMASALSEDLQHALDKLSPHQRILVALADIEGLPYKEIADMIDKPIGTVRSRLHRAHKQLRATLRQLRKEGKTASKRTVHTFELASW